MVFCVYRATLTENTKLLSSKHCTNALADTKRFFFFFRSCLHTKGCCCLFGIFLAWETLNVTIPVLNDSKYIEMSVYNIFVLSIIGAVVSLTLEGSEYYDASYTILSMYLIMSTSLTMLFVFAPKVRILWLKTYHLHM